MLESYASAQELKFSCYALCLLNLPFTFLLFACFYDNVNAIEFMFIFYGQQLFKISRAFTFPLLIQVISFFYHSPGVVKVASLKSDEGLPSWNTGRTCGGKAPRINEIALSWNTNCYSLIRDDQETLLRSVKPLVRVTYLIRSDC